MPSANLPHPTHPVVLTDGITTLGLNLCGNDGVNDITAISSTPYPRTGLKISQGDTEYSDQELPFTSTHQDDFSGGRAAEKFEDDKSRLADEYRCETRFPGVVFPGAQERYAPITTTVFGENWFTSPTRMNDKIKGRYVARKFVASATGTIKACLLMLDTTSELLYNLSAQIWSHNAVGDKPNVELGWLLFNGGFTTHGIYPYLFLDTDGVAVTSGTTYWLVLSDTTEARNIVYDSDPTKSGYIKTSTDAITWATHAGDLYFRLTIAPTNAQAHFFMYKGAQYCLGDGYLRINGDRGVADASAATTLQDGSKAWTADEFIGAVVYVFRGTGAGQYRAISTNGTVFLVISSAWDTIPDTTSEYVILGANSWRNVLAATGYVQAALAGEFIYMAAPGAVVKRYNCYNSGGTYTERNADETVYADKILATYDSALRKWYLWGVAPNDTYHASSVWRMSVPPLWAALYRDRGTIDTWSSPWDDLEISNVTVAKSATEDDTIALTVAAGFTTGMLATKSIESTDLTTGSKLSFAIKSSVDVADEKLFLVFGDDAVGTLSSSLSGDLTSGRPRPPDMVYKFDGATTYTDLAASRDGDTGTSSSITIVTTDYIYIGASKPFSRVNVNVGTANIIASVLSAEYMGSRGAIWTAVSGLADGTASPAGTTLGQDGVISFAAPYDWEAWTVSTNSLYWIRLKVTVNLTAPITIVGFTVWMQGGFTPLPALSAGVWTWVSLSTTFLKHPWPNDRAINSFGLYLSGDYGAQVISLRGSLLLTETAPEYIAIQTRKRITNLVASGEERTNPWVIAEGELFEIQTQNSNAVVKIPLDELETLGSPDMGLGACTNDVYLYFTLGKRVERYNNGLLENLGPDLDNGLPSGRAGIIKQLISLPGGSIGAIVQGSQQDSILVRKNGWHEVYRTPLAMTTTSPLTYWSTTRIGGATAQEIPGVGTVMWIQQGGSILKMNFPLSESEAGGDYVFASHVTTPWISMGMLDVQKRLMSLKVYSENLLSTPTVEEIIVYYQLESAGTDAPGDWSVLDIFSTSPFQIRTFAAGYAARRVRLRFMFYNQTYSRLLKLRAWVLNAILSLDVRYLHTLRVRIDDDPQDLTGKSDHTTQAETTKAQLVTWMSSPPTVLTMYTMYATNTAKSVIVMPFSFKPYKVRMGSGADAKEALVVDVPVLEVA